MNSHEHVGMISWKQSGAVKETASFLFSEQKSPESEWQEHMSLQLDKLQVSQICLEIPETPCLGYIIHFPVKKNEYSEYAPDLY